MKKIDAAASQRLSMSYIGTGSVRRPNTNANTNINTNAHVFGPTPNSGPITESPTKSRPSVPLIADNFPRQTPQNQAQSQEKGANVEPEPRSLTGQALVEQVILPIISSTFVRSLLVQSQSLGVLNKTTTPLPPYHTHSPTPNTTSLHQPSNPSPSSPKAFPTSQPLHPNLRIDS